MYVYDISINIGAYILGYIDIHGKEKIYDIIYDSLCKKLYKLIFGETGINPHIAN